MFPFFSRPKRCAASYFFLRFNSRCATSLHERATVVVAVARFDDFVGIFGRDGRLHTHSQLVASNSLSTPRASGGFVASSRYRSADVSPSRGSHCAKLAGYDV